MKYAQLVVGPAGCGKSTYCATVQEHCQVNKRICRVVNLDPAAENFQYDCYVDVRDLVKVEEVMDYFSLGPNGALIFAMEYLLKKREWLEETFDSSFSDDDFILIDCPGQIELYSHNPVMKDYVKMLQAWDYQIVCVYCLDVSFVTDTPKFIAGTIAALAAMVELEIPHISVLTKCDLMSPKELDDINILLDKQPFELISDLRSSMPERYINLNKALLNIIDNWSMVSYALLNLDDEDSIDQVLLLADNAIQYGENLEPKEYPDLDED